MQLLFHPDTSLCKKFTLVILLLILAHVNRVNAERSCHQCHGINCLRNSYEVTQKCLSDLDICVTVFDGQTVHAQGCLEQLSEELRTKCQDKNIGDLPTLDSEELSECYKCNQNLCNNLASSTFECIQCDSDNDENCRTNPQSLVPTRCSISRTPNEYCFVKTEGQRVIRGCSNTLEEQQSCLLSSDCMICQPSELKACNGLSDLTKDDNGSVDEGNGDTGSGGASEGESTGNGDSGTGVENTSKRICHQCNGINCLRTSYQAKQECLNNLDICVTVFDGQTVLAQGCLEQLSEELRNKCNAEAEEFNELSECVKCNTNLCNNMASKSFECIQCDSENDENCRNNPSSLIPSRCVISRTPNEYCFVKIKDERIIRGCSNTLEAQLSCLGSADCMICQPSELNGCNDIDIRNDNGSDSGSGNGSDSDSGGENPSDGGSESGSDNGGSDGSGENKPNDGGSGNGSDNTGSDNGSADDGNGSVDNPSDGGSESGSGDGGSDGSGENKPNDGDSGNNSNGGGSDSGSGNGGNGSEDENSGNGSNSGKVSVEYLQFLLFIINLIVVFFVTK